MQVFFSDKSDGDLLFKANPEDTKNAIDTKEANETVRKNRILFFEKNGISPTRIINLAGIHGVNILTIKESDLGSGALDPETGIKNTDGLISAVSNSYLMITGADCFPIFFEDRTKSVIGAVHAGWRGILEKIIPKMISKLKNELNSDPKNIEIWIGPGIKSCHFEVKDDTAGLFEKDHDSYIIKKEGLFIDLPGIMKKQLAESGINSSKITEHQDCTYCAGHKWFSRRRDKPKITEANGFIIWQK